MSYRNRSLGMTTVQYYSGVVQLKSVSQFVLCFTGGSFRQERLKYEEV